MRLYSVVAAVVELDENISQLSSPPPSLTSGFLLPCLCQPAACVLVESDLLRDLGRQQGSLLAVLLLLEAQCYGDIF